MPVKVTFSVVWNCVASEIAPPALKVIAPEWLFSSSENEAIVTEALKVVLFAFVMMKLLAFTVSAKLTIPACSIVTDGAVSVDDAEEPTAPVTVILLSAAAGTLNVSSFAPSIVTGASVVPKLMFSVVEVSFVVFSSSTAPE